MKLSEHINQAYKMLSAVSVSGDSVDYMAMARQELRAAHKLALESEKEVASDGGQ